MLAVPPLRLEGAWICWHVLHSCARWCSSKWCCWWWDKWEMWRWKDQQLSVLLTPKLYCRDQHLCLLHREAPDHHKHGPYFVVTSPSRAIPRNIASGFCLVPCVCTSSSYSVNRTHKCLWKRCSNICPLFYAQEAVHEFTSGLSVLCDFLVYPNTNSSSEDSSGPLSLDIAVPLSLLWILT